MIKRYFGKINIYLPNIYNDFFLCGFLSFFICLSLCLFFKINEPTFSRDSIGYIQAVKSLFAFGNPEDIFIEQPNMKTPLFPLYVFSSLMYFGFTAEISGLAINFFLASLLPAIVYLITQELFHNISLSRLSCFLITFNPLLYNLGTEIQRDILYLFLAGLSLYCFIKCIKSRGVAALFLSGTFFSLAFLSRYESLELLPLYFVTLLFTSLKTKRPFKRLFFDYFVFSFSSAIVFVVFVFLSSSYFLSFDLAARRFDLLFGF